MVKVAYLELIVLGEDFRFPRPPGAAATKEASSDSATLNPLWERKPASTSTSGPPSSAIHSAVHDEDDDDDDDEDDEEYNKNSNKKKVLSSSPSPVQPLQTHSQIQKPGFILHLFSSIEIII